MEIEGRLKTALDESRLLILGAQVLFGFQFEAVFQELFPSIPQSSRYLHCLGLTMLLISIGPLIAPSLFHQIIFEGESTPGAIAAATVLAGASLLPLTIGLGAAAFVAFEHLFSRGVGIAAGGAVVFFKATESADAAWAAGVGALIVLLGCWLAYPVWRRSRNMRHA
ncbi:MAG TPA: DUF6328 family protein [Bradyrhizobium sp.]|nr:DUF6328 family protein [Bradyrhizobium sp.]